jgi:hypothetical protein
METTEQTVSEAVDEVISEIAPKEVELGEDESEGPEPEKKDVEEEAEQPEEKKEDDRLASRFAILTRKDKALREREMRLKDVEEKVKQVSELEELAKSNPIELLKKYGHDYQTVTDFVLNEQQPTDKMKETALETRLRKLEEKEAAERENLAKQKYEETISGFKADIGDHITEKEGDYPLLKAGEGSDTVYNVIENYHATQGEILPVDEACKYVENTLEEQFKTFLGTEKGKRIVQEVMGGKEEKPEPTQDSKVSSQTLTNKQSANQPTPREKKLSDEESIEEAAKLLKYT